MAWRSALLFGVSLAVVAVVLAVALPHSFFEDWGWLAGPAAWAGCALVAGAALSLPPLPVLVGAALSALPSLVGGRGRSALGRRAARDRPLRRVVRAARRPRAGGRSDGPRAARSRRARHRRVEGDRRGHRGRARRRRARRSRSPRARARRSDESAARIGATGFVFDSDDLDAVPALIADVESALGPIDIYVANTGGPPMGPDPLGVHPRAVGGGAPYARALADGVHRARCCPGCGSARWGRIVAVSLELGARAARPRSSSPTRTGPACSPRSRCSRGNVAADGVTLNSVLAGRIATDRDRRRAGLARGRAGRRARAGAGRAAGDGRGVRRAGGVPVFGAGRATSPARRCWSTAGSRRATH